MSKPMINSLPDLVLGLIFSDLTTADQIRKISLVCKRCNEIVYTSVVWKRVDFNWQQNLTFEDPQQVCLCWNQRITLSECLYLKWNDLCIILKQCNKLHV